MTTTYSACLTSKTNWKWSFQPKIVFKMVNVKEKTIKEGIESLEEKE